MGGREGGERDEGREGRRGRDEGRRMGGGREAGREKGWEM